LVNCHSTFINCHLRCATWVSINWELRTVKWQLTN